MNGKKAKAIRKAVYGDFTSNSEGRRYKRKRLKNFLKIRKSVIMADEKRHAYQQAKKMYKRGELVL